MNSTDGPVFWYDQEDMDVFGDFYLRVRREQLRRATDRAYAAFGRRIADEIRQKTESRDLKYVRYNSLVTWDDRVSARAVIEWEVFDGLVCPETEQAVRYGILL